MSQFPNPQSAIQNPISPRPISQSGYRVSKKNHILCYFFLDIQYRQSYAGFHTIFLLTLTSVKSSLMAKKVVLKLPM